MASLGTIVVASVEALLAQELLEAEVTPLEDGRKSGEHFPFALLASDGGCIRPQGLGGNGGGLKAG